MKNKLSKVMTFSATDSTLGAGLQADILTLTSLGCYPLSIVTGVSVQDTIGVESLSAIKNTHSSAQDVCCKASLTHDLNFFLQQ